MFGSLMGDGFDDLIGGQMQRMNSMMNSFFGNPFGNDMFGQGGGGGGGRSRSMSLMPFDDPSQGMLSPFGFPNMNQIMQNMSQMSNNPNCHSFSSSSVMTMTTGPDGKPQVYQASQSTRAAPGGIRETKKSVCDSRTGVKKLAIGRHIGDRGHVKEKEQNMFTGQLEQNDEFINLEEEEEPEFSREWQTRAQQFRPRSAHEAIGYHQPPNYRNNKEYLALPPAASSAENSKAEKVTEKATTSKTDGKNVKQDSQQKKRSHRSKPYNKRKEKTSNE